MTIPADLNVYISGAAFVLGAYFFALYIGMIVWCVRDVRARSRDVLVQIMVAVLVALFTIPGLIVYLLLRPHTTLAEEYERSLTEEALLQDLDPERVCPVCSYPADPDFVVCPSCHTQLRLRCVGCGRLLSPDWDVCPYCGLYREQSDEDGDEKSGELTLVTEEDLDGVADLVPDLAVAGEDAEPNGASEAAEAFAGLADATVDSTSDETPSDSEQSLLEPTPE